MRDYKMLVLVQQYSSLSSDTQCQEVCVAQGKKADCSAHPTLCCLFLSLVTTRLLQGSCRGCAPFLPCDFMLMFLTE